MRMSRRRLVVGAVTIAAACLGGTQLANADQDRITICHKPGTPAEKTLTVAAPATGAHLNHGDQLGPCGVPPTTVPPTTVATTVPPTTVPPTTVAPTTVPQASTSTTVSAP